MNANLLNQLSLFKRSVLPKGTILFHGCREQSLHTDKNTKQLGGSRKWFSQSAVYAVSYSFCDSGDLGDRLLWKCELLEDVECLIGSQYSLIAASEMERAFAWRFPNEFESYAQAIFGNTHPKALLDFCFNGVFHKEILLTNPQSLIKALKIQTLPDDKCISKQLALAEYGV
jgi:hypothetical protein